MEDLATNSAQIELPLEVGEQGVGQDTGICFDLETKYMNNVMPW